MLLGKRGRPNKYETHVKPRLKEVEEFCTRMTEKQIAETLGVGYSAWREYKNKYPALKAVLKRGREMLVSDLRSTLIRRAKGYTYTETKVEKEAGRVVKTVITQKSMPPDVAALNLLLKNYDRDNWANDPQTLALKRDELEMRRKHYEKMEEENW